MPTEFIEFDRVWLKYNQTSDFVIEEINISIREHEFVSIVGPSGCGKSTFMKLCTGLRPPTKGTVMVDGRQEFCCQTVDQCTWKYSRSECGVFGSNGHTEVSVGDSCSPNCP